MPYFPRLMSARSMRYRFLAANILSIMRILSGSTLLREVLQRLGDAQMEVDRSVTVPEHGKADFCHACSMRNG